LVDQLDQAACGSLTASIEEHGQKQPVLGRKIRAPDKYEVELVYGARRLFAAQQLGIDLLVEVRDIDDRSALVEMDIENRVRDDISPYERGLSYKRWLVAGYFRNQVEMAKSLAVSEAQVSRLLRYADLPAVVVAAFASGRDIREEWAVSLAKRCKDPEKRNGVIRRARALSESIKVSSPQIIFDELTRDRSRSAVKAQLHDKVVRSSQGLPLLRVAYRAKTVHFIVERERLIGTMLDVIAARIKDTLDGEVLALPHLAQRGNDAEEPAGGDRVTHLRLASK
jgi:ParB/RepB/Spo0J family partition protein